MDCMNKNEIIAYRNINISNIFEKISTIIKPFLNHEKMFFLAFTS